MTSQSQPGYDECSLASADAEPSAADGQLTALCEAVLAFWGDSDAWGDNATVTRLAGRFVPVVNMARRALGAE